MRIVTSAAASAGAGATLPPCNASSQQSPPVSMRKTQFANRNRRWTEGSAFSASNISVDGMVSLSLMAILSFAYCLARFAAAVEFPRPFAAFHYKCDEAGGRVALRHRCA
jgi:hypothetical protein